MEHLGHGVIGQQHVVFLTGLPLAPAIPPLEQNALEDHKQQGLPSGKPAHE
jgi:hypothetical protein